ncbi:sodium:solute symporter family transporter [Planomonospora venezuelensis]|uniref:sodium:solute symporter family transporter n=1 Tax=Planomonospora venezuelensis TaxID=1999 RepID=UPI0031E62D83
MLASRNRDVIKRNMSALPAYSLLLGLIALLGYMAIAAGTTPIGKDNNTIVPRLFDQMFPDWFTGVAYAAVGIGALVPAAIMSIAAANLFTRNVYKEYIKRDASDADEARVSKITSLLVKVGAVACILFLDTGFSIDLQLIGGVIILQTLPAVALGLYTRWFHRGGLIAGWAAGMTAGMVLLYNVGNPATGKLHFAGSAFPLERLGLDTKMTVYAGILALAVNLVVAALGTVLARSMKLADGGDATRPDHYLADEGDPRVKDLDLTPGTH